MSYVIIQCLIIFAVICVIFKHSGFPKIFPLLYIGLCLMTASNIMYMMNMSNLRQEWLVNTFRDLRYLLHTYKISMHTLKNISVIGEVMMLSFFVLFASTLDKNNRFKYPRLYMWRTSKYSRSILILYRDRFSKFYNFV